jgi:hypothetical protein
MNRLAVQFLGKGEQHLGHVAARLEPVRARAVIPLPETLQFELKPQHLDAEFLGLQPAFLCPAVLLFGAVLLLFGALRLPVAFQNQRTHHRLQRFTVLRKPD